MEMSEHLFLTYQIDPASGDLYVNIPGAKQDNSLWYFPYGSFTEKSSMRDHDYHNSG